MSDHRLNEPAPPCLDADQPAIDPASGTMVDLSSHSTIAMMLQMVQALSRANDPRQVLSVFGEGLRQILSFSAYVSVSTRGLGDGQYKVTRFVRNIEGEKLEQRLWQSLVSPLPRA